MVQTRFEKNGVSRPLLAFKTIRLCELRKIICSASSRFRPRQAHSLLAVLSLRALPRNSNFKTFKIFGSSIESRRPQALDANQLNDIPENFRPTPELIQSLQKIAEVIEREGIRPMDLQLRITAERAYVVDPEFFAPASRRGEVMSAQDEIQTLIDHLQTRMK